MDEMLTGWLLDMYADEKVVTLWLLEENGQHWNGSLEPLSNIVADGR